MPLQDLPPEILIDIFEWSNDFRTATALGATNRYLHSVWTENTDAILRSVARIVLPHPREANLLADRYEEITEVKPTGDKTADAIRRATLLMDELRMIQNISENSHRFCGPPRRQRSTCLILHGMLEPPEFFLKQVYFAVLLYVTQTSDHLSRCPVSFPRTVFQTMRMGDLKLLYHILPAIVGYATSHLYYDLDAHFRPHWTMNADKHPREPILRLGNFLYVLSFHPTRDALPTVHKDKHCLPSAQFDEIIEQWEDCVNDCGVEDIFASASFCVLEGDHWTIDCSLDP